MKRGHAKEVGADANQEESVAGATVNEETLTLIAKAEKAVEELDSKVEQLKKELAVRERVHAEFAREYNAQKPRGHPFETPGQ